MSGLLRERLYHVSVSLLWPLQNLRRNLQLGQRLSSPCLLLCLWMKCPHPGKLVRFGSAGLPSKLTRQAVSPRHLVISLSSKQKSFPLEMNASKTGAAPLRKGKSARSYATDKPASTSVNASSRLSQLQMKNLQKKKNHSINLWNKHRDFSFRHSQTKQSNPYVQKTCIIRLKIWLCHRFTCTSRKQESPQTPRKDCNCLTAPGFPSGSLSTTWLFIQGPLLFVYANFLLL